MPRFPFTEVKSVRRWTNYSGSLPQREVPLFCTPDVVGTAGERVPRKLRRHGDALGAILEHCFTAPASSLRAIGSRWSFSSIVSPELLVVDTANLNTMAAVPEHWLTAGYRERRPHFTPMFVQGGSRIASINRRLLEKGLALQTSGAGDGHRLAGCIATGTHGAAIDIGAVHDTLLGIHLLVEPRRGVLLQQAERVLSPDVAGWLARETGIPTDDVADTELFAAAQVALGSLGFVHGAILETAPIYSLHGRILARPFDDADVWQTLGDLHTRRLHPDVAERPFHFEIVLHPYPSHGRPGAFVRMLWKGPGEAAPHESPLPTSPDLASDRMGMIAQLSDAIDGPLLTPVLARLISEQLERRYRPGQLDAQVPGMIFGPTSLPPGNGASTEVIVALPHARRMLELLYEVLGSEARHGRHLLGPVALRFVPQTRSLLGMSQAPMSCYVELPSIRTHEVLGIYHAFYAALERDGIPFGCHWGQHHGMTPERLARYYGANADRWRAARDRLLPTREARRVFSSALLPEIGLE
jgi:D-arabinono-1,4-lactone oxidase